MRTLNKNQPNWGGDYLCYIHHANLPMVEDMIAQGKARFGATLADGTVLLEIEGHDY